jgi:hypothetical protein
MIGRVIPVDVPRPFVVDFGLSMYDYIENCNHFFLLDNVLHGGPEWSNYCSGIDWTECCAGSVYMKLFALFSLLFSYLLYIG